MRYWLSILAMMGLLTACSSQPVVNKMNSAQMNSAQAQQNRQTIERFYRAFQQRDAETMASSYAPDATFSDPVFTDLQGQQVGDMWRMLTGKAQDFSLVFDGVRADNERGEAHWVATYTFSQTGRKVVNDIHAQFVFKDGKIISHHDQFDLWRWSAQALGVKGHLLGWTPLVKNKIRQQAKMALDKYQASARR